MGGHGGGWGQTLTHRSTNCGFETLHSFMVLLNLVMPSFLYHYLFILSLCFGARQVFEKQGISEGALSAHQQHVPLR